MMKFGRANMQIRKALLKDTSAIVELIQHTYKVSYQGYLPDKYLNDLHITEDILTKWNDRLKRHECYVVQEQEQIVAFLMLEDEPTEIFEICVLYVKPNYQKKGIGSLLVKYACEIKEKSGYKLCKVWTMKNGPSIAFYNKMGFFTTNEEQLWKFDNRIIKMEKRL